MQPHTVTVYCSSSSAIPRIYLEAGAALGRAIAAEHWKLVYGGNCVGLMGILANAARDSGGKVIGVTPQLFIDKGVDDRRCDEFIVTENMRQRKAVMEERGDAFIAMPGGLGTFEEIFEIIVGKQLAYHNKPIVLLNVDRYYTQFLGQLDTGIDQKFIKPAARQLFHVADNVADAIAYIRDYQPAPIADKWFEKIVPSGAE
jgi:uncharacterized protein (TIGR00730 family)